MSGERADGTPVVLTLDDITDLRAYERERDRFRSHVIALKKKRRVPVGELMTVVFENQDTVRFQIQEMARAERIVTDAAIETELEAFNPLISRPGRLGATLFIELTSGQQLREWLPRLHGVERRFELHVGRGERREELPVTPRGAGPAPTSTVHFLRWKLTPSQTAKLADGPAEVVCTHPAYRTHTRLGDATRRSLVADLR